MYCVISETNGIFDRASLKCYVLLAVQNHKEQCFQMDSLARAYSISKSIILRTPYSKVCIKKSDCSEQKVIPSHCFNRIIVYSLEGIKYFLNSIRHYGDSHYVSMNSYSPNSIGVISIYNIISNTFHWYFLHFEVMSISILWIFQNSCSICF